MQTHPPAQEEALFWRMKKEIVVNMLPNEHISLFGVPAAQTGGGGGEEGAGSGGLRPREQTRRGNRH